MACHMLLIGKSLVGSLERASWAQCGQKVTSCSAVSWTDQGHVGVFRFLPPHVLPEGALCPVYANVASVAKVLGPLTSISFFFSRR